MKSLRYIFAFSLFLYAYSLSSTGDIVIRIGIVTPLEGLLIDQIEASFMRIDQLNNQNSSLISPNVKLEGIWKNPGSQAAAAISSAYELVNTQEVAAMIGSGYSSYTTLSAYISNFAPKGSIPHCDGSSTSPLLSNKGTYPQFFRTIPTDILCGQSMAQYAVIQKWLNIATIFSDSKYGSGLNTAFVDAARALNITILTQQTFLEKTIATSSAVARNIVLSIKESNARIIMYFGQPGDLKILITEAKKEGIYGLGYAWVSADAMSNIPKSETIDYSGLLYFYPKERAANSVTTAFESYHAANHTSAAIVARYEASYPGSNNYLSASPIVTDYGWFTASCIDALAMYMEAAVQKISQAGGISIDDAARVLATGNIF